jgi:aminoglycoside phosphotransferase family enzyme
MNREQINRIVREKAVPHPTQTIRLVETHISWVLLADRDVYKIKKPLRFSFLDFSTLEKRGQYCGLEVTLNRRLAPGMYLGVLPLKEQGGTIRIGEGEGTLVDYAVWMRRMDEGQQMDVLLEAGGVGQAAVRELADMLADFHGRARKVQEAETWEELYAEFEDISTVSGWLGKHFGKETDHLVTEVNGWARRFLESISGRIEERKAMGFVVEGHGDLHSRNIFLLNPPVIFDCIEFNEALRTLDVLSEVGFLCMDLERFGRADLADAFMERYQQRTRCLRDATDRQLFLFYKLYRANVRLKVHALQLQKGLVSGATREMELKRVSEYLRLFRGYFEEGKGFV